MLFLVRFPSQRSGTPYYPNLDSIATCPPPSLPQLSSTQQPLPPRLRCHSPGGGETGLFLPLCVHALAGWLTGRLAVGDKRTLLLRPVAQPRQSLYYIHRGWSAVNRDERGKRSDNCWFFFSKHRRHMQGRFPELSSSGEVTVVRRWVTVENPRCGPRRSAPQGPQRFGSGVWSCSTSIPFDEGRPVPPATMLAVTSIYPIVGPPEAVCARGYISGLCLPSHMVGSSLPKKTKKVSRTVVL